MTKNAEIIAKLPVLPPFDPEPIRRAARAHTARREATIRQMFSVSR